MLFLTGLCAIPISIRGFVRNLLFARRDVIGAFSLDVGVSAVQLGSVALLYVMDLLDWWHALLAVGAANLAGSVGFFALARRMFQVNRLRAIVEAKRSWSEGKWLLASSMVWTAGIYLYPWVVYAMSGGDQAGIWGVCWQLASVGNPLVMAVQNVLGPQIAHAFVHQTRVQFRFYVLKSTTLFGIAVLVLAVTMALLCGWLLKNLFGPSYATSAEVAALLVFTPVFFAISFGMSRGLFSLGHARVDLFANIMPLITLFVIGIYASRHFGALGAAIAMLAGLVLGGAYRLVAFLRISGRHSTTPAVEVLA
jgi:O-antigen/teichoic acid export membrane protein